MVQDEKNLKILRQILFFKKGERNLSSNSGVQQMIHVFLILFRIFDTAGIIVMTSP